MCYTQAPHHTQRVQNLKLANSQPFCAMGSYRFREKVNEKANFFFYICLFSFFLTCPLHCTLELRRSSSVGFENHDGACAISYLIFAKLLALISWGENTGAPSLVKNYHFSETYLSPADAGCPDIDRTSRVIRDQGVPETAHQGKVSFLA